MVKSRLVLLAVLMAFIMVTLTVLDILREPETVPWGEIALDIAEKAILLGGLAAIAWMLVGLHDLREAQSAMANNLARSIAQGDSWRSDRRAEIAALGRAIEDQFRAWHLTAAEIDIAGLMLKGVSLKEIALARNTSEATIRQQAQSVYRKSGLSGRAELSAYFLDSLFAEATDLRKETLRVVPVNH